MRISEQFESYSHPEITDGELKSLAEEVSSKVSQCRVGYTSIWFKDGSQVSFILTEESTRGIFSNMVRHGDKYIAELSLVELKFMERDWGEVLNSYHIGKELPNKYTELIKKIIWVDCKRVMNYIPLLDKLITLKSLFDSVDTEYKQVGVKEKAESRRELERLYIVTYNICNKVNKIASEIEVVELTKLDRELEKFRCPLVVDARDSRGKYAELIRFCKNINWNKVGLTKLINDVLVIIDAS